MKRQRKINAKIKSAVAKYRCDPKVLRRLTRSLRHPETRKACRLCAKQLLILEPNSIDAIASLIFAYADGRGELKMALDLAHQRSQRDPQLFNKILDKACKNLGVDERVKLNDLLQNYNNESAEIAQRQQINLRAQHRFLERTDVEANSCDVIAVASNEGPYITEFIHHCLYQGFSNLFIGLNNDTSGQTGPIIAAIAKHYPQVRLINTDQEHQQGKQRGSYCKLYDEASKITKASHCMVVDVDEFWVVYPLHTTVKEFLTAHPQADVISSNWLHCHRGKLFDNPLDLSNTRLELTNQFKSLFRYGIAMTDLGAHVPTVLAKPKIQHTISDGQAVLSKNINGLQRLTKRGIQACIHTANTGWVIHRHTRSELEYAAKLLNPDVNKPESPFKPNRGGYLLREESVDSRQLATNLLGLTHQAPQAYINSLDAFIDRCGIRDLITAARAEIGEEQIVKRILAMDPDLIRSCRMIWKRTFQGTRFLELLEECCLKSNVEQIT